MCFGYTQWYNHIDRTEFSKLIYFAAFITFTIVLNALPQEKNNKITDVVNFIL